MIHLIAPRWSTSSSSAAAAALTSLIARPLWSPHHLLLEQAFRLRCVVTELSQDCGRVFTKKGSGPAAARRSTREPHRRTELADRPGGRMRRVPEIIPRQQVRIIEDLPEVLQRGARDTRLIEQLEPMRCGLVDGHLLDGGAERFPILMAEVGIAVASVVE